MPKLLVFLAAAVVGWAHPVLLQMGPKSIALDFPGRIWPEWQGPVNFAGEGKLVRGLSLGPIVQALGGVGEIGASLCSPRKKIFSEP